MANKFITKGDINLDINGVEFELDSTDLEMVKRLEKFAKEGQEYAEELKGREDVVEALIEATQYAVDTIDSILGEGSCIEIFKDQKVSLLKATDVINYINDELGNARKATSAKFSPNRAARRSK